MSLKNVANTFPRKKKKCGQQKFFRIDVSQNFIKLQLQNLLTLPGFITCSQAVSQ